ncbi:class II aldolase/adducin family protein [Plantactinospora sp. DSM 117369]
MNYLQGDLRDQLAYVGQDVVRTGLVVGSGGNLSARLPDGDSCWVTAGGTWLDRLDRPSFVRVRISDGSVLTDYPAHSDVSLRSGDPAADGGPAQPSRPAGQVLQDGAALPDGTALPVPRSPDTAASVAGAASASSGVPASGAGATATRHSALPHAQGAGGPSRAETAGGPTRPAAAPTSEVELHLATYRARPDVNAIVHLHPQTVLLLDALGEEVRLVTTDHGFYLRRVTRVPFRLPGTTELAELAADATRDGTNCLVLSRHGCSVLADSVELAHKRAANLEEAARLTYRALAAGRLAELPELPAEFLARIEGGATTV